MSDTYQLIFRALILLGKHTECLLYVMIRVKQGPCPNHFSLLSPFVPSTLHHNGDLIKIQKIAPSTCLNMIFSSGIFTNSFNKTSEGQFVGQGFGFIICNLPTYTHILGFGAWGGGLLFLHICHPESSNCVAGCVNSMGVTTKSL